MLQDVVNEKLLSVMQGRCGLVLLVTPEDTLTHHNETLSEGEVLRVFEL